MYNVTSDLNDGSSPGLYIDIKIVMRADHTIWGLSRVPRAKISGQVSIPSIGPTSGLDTLGAYLKRPGQGIPPVYVLRWYRHQLTKNSSWKNVKDPGKLNAMRLDEMTHCPSLYCKLLAFRARVIGSGDHTRVEAGKRKGASWLLIRVLGANRGDIKDSIRCMLDDR